MDPANQKKAVINWKLIEAIRENMPEGFETKGYNKV